MGGSTQVMKEFETPDRSSTITSLDHAEEKKEITPSDTADEMKTIKMAEPKTVTPPEPGSREDVSGIKKEPTDVSPLQIDVDGQLDSPEDGNKQVRFDGDSEEAMKESPIDSPASSTSSQRGLVSRRGGRCTSPGRISSKAPSAKETVLEFKTYRSPSRVKREESDTVPSLCSANSGEQKEKKGPPSAAAAALTKESVNVKREDEDEGSSGGDKKPSSISCNSAFIENTSPLASDADHSQDSSSTKAKASTSRQDTAQQLRKSNVTFSPKPPTKKEYADRPVRTPTRSPTRGHFQTLPSLDDAALKSPVGLFLSPHPPTPSKEEASLKPPSKEDLKPPSKAEKRADENKALTKSPKTRDQERERFVTTPTDFSTDYGRGHPNSAGFDASNVLSWLHSPTANGLFSPGGGLGSIMNTPRGGASLGGGPRTPRTPTVSTSFFFSDVAGLPRSGDYISPKPGGADPSKRGGARGLSNIICISPLASSRSKNGSSNQATTPINYKDVFASPGDKNNPRSLPLLGDSPAKGMKSRDPPHRTGSRDPSLDAVSMAERDLMEDEDLSVLLQLASNTPRSTGERTAAVSTSDGTHVFRSPNGRHPSGSAGDENLPSLQLPIIGGREHESNGARLSRKTHSREPNESAEEFKHGGMAVRPGKPNEAVRTDKGVDDKRKQGSKSSVSKKPNKKTSMPPAPPPYPMAPPPYPHPGAEVPYYPPMPPGMPPGGSMRVVVGGPPPSRGPKASGSPHNGPPGTGSPHGHRPYHMGGDPNYPPPPYPPPPGHYHHPGVPPPHMQGVPPHHPYHSHYPPPPHHPAHRPPMPLYGSHPPPGKAKATKKTKGSKPTKGTKRPAGSLPAKTSSATKKKKSSPSGAPKKKNKSPQLTEKGERQKAAATIHSVNAASGGKNDKAAALAAAILRGVTMRPSGKWQAQLYFAGKSRYIGVFDTREKAALAYEIAREKLKSEKSAADSGGGLTPKATEAAVNSARKAAFEGVNERDPRIATK